MHKAPRTATSLSAKWQEITIGRLPREIKLTATVSSSSVRGYEMVISEPLSHSPYNLIRPSLRVALTLVPNDSPKTPRSFASTVLPISNSYHSPPLAGTRASTASTGEAFASFWKRPRAPNACRGCPQWPVISPKVVGASPFVNQCPGDRTDRPPSQRENAATNHAHQSTGVFA
jgi:hypothetical protein